MSIDAASETIHSAGTSIRDCWNAPPGVRIPDFIICGAMKCGTSTVRQMLNRHPGVTIPNKEIHFFDIDDQLEHSDFAFHQDGRWVFPALEADPQLYWNWYARFFVDAPATNLVGEDSTCYLPSANAARRIAQQEKPIKAIICLRHPTKRAYSQHWHMLRTGRCMFNFEDTLRLTPHFVLGRSLYLRQIQRFLAHIPRSRVFFFILEEFIANPAEVTRRLTDFLGLPFESLPRDALEVHANQLRLPRRIKLQILRNRLLRTFDDSLYLNNLPIQSSGMVRKPLIVKALNRLHAKINPATARSAPAMKPETKMFLDQYFQRELDGINELVGTNVMHLWFSESANSKP